MDEGRLARALANLVGSELASDLSSDFVKIRRDFTTRTLERSSPGKFVETVVQCFQYISEGTFDSRPNIDDYLNVRIENTSLPDGLRVCASRVARSIYTLRNKRNIAHKNAVDANIHDLAYTHQAAAWIVAEFLRYATGISMQESGALIELIQAPAGTLVEEIGDVRLVHADVSVRTEILILLHSYYPDPVSLTTIVKSLNRRKPATVRNRLSELYSQKLAHRGKDSSYRLTNAGHAEAVAEIIALSK